MYGAKLTAEAAGFRKGSVGERSVGCRRDTVRYSGGNRSEYASMSSDNPGENPGHRKSKVS